MTQSSSDDNPKQTWFENYTKGLFQSVHKPPSKDGSLYPCPCCRYKTLAERGGFDICPVCFWEDDGKDDEDAPIRAALFDGTPIAAHPALLGGVQIEDTHDLVRLSQVEQRYHATSMASLILRGDLEADGSALNGGRLISAPVLIDSENGASSPPHRRYNR